GGGSDTTPPTTPGTPTAAGVTATGATLSWTPATDTGGSGLAGYTVHREQGATDTQLGQSTTASITLTGLTPSTQYQVYIRARDGAGNLSANSATTTFTTTAGGGDPEPGTGCTATGTVQTQWSTGYVVQPVTIRNNGTTATTGWTATFTLPAGHTITGSWNATLTTSGQTVTARSLPYNATIAPGATTAFGYQATRPNGNTTTPAAYTCATP
ncbi:cellulose binding domain-containing protein, partial [Microtetraspora sp. NBRC 13810]|uniref:cellulose binding domain-containing protein n=1 Tax=Microtetraspora sp. NBRC 13810 TaxID=3030990 RepID=UPI0025530035